MRSHPVRDPLKKAVRSLDLQLWQCITVHELFNQIIKMRQEAQQIRP
jgi:hypothetical protein